MVSTMSDLVHKWVPERRPDEYKDKLIEIMGARGLVSPEDLLAKSKKKLQQELAEDQDIIFVQMADMLQLKIKLEETEKRGEELIDATDSVSTTDTLSGVQSRRSSSASPRRSRSRNGCGYHPHRSLCAFPRRSRSRHRHRGYHRHLSHDCYHRHLYHRGYDRRRTNRLHSRSCNVKAKPLLWEAVENNDIQMVQTLLQQGDDPEETYKHWPPSMKAAEENHKEILGLLIEKKCDIEAENQKGRTALSFAAAPSNDGSRRRSTPVDTLRLLLESRANPEHKNVYGMTPKQIAEQQMRTDSVAIFESFGF